MANLKHAHNELFRRSTDERFASLPALAQYCMQQREASTEHWNQPQSVVPDVFDGQLGVRLGTDGEFLMNDWSFSQLCGLARVHKETVNRLAVETAVRVLRETLPTGTKPLQVFSNDETVRSIHGASYTRLWNTDLLEIVQEFATDFTPPQEASGGGTGLYAGEQDMFAFLIDPTGWAEIGEQAYAPGVFVWNSEVGRRSVGISTFWFQAVCANHIVWDACEVTEIVRKHTANVHDVLSEIRRTWIDQVVIVDDASVDHTRHALNQWLTHSRLPAAVVRNSRRLGSSRSRNVALQAATSPLVLFVDDDCLLSPYCVWGLEHTFTLLRKDHPRTACIHAPFYFRDLVPVHFRPMAQFGLVDLVEGTYTTSLKAFPVEYLQSACFCDDRLRLLMPLPIHHLCGIFLGRRDALLAVGGFPEYFTWTNGFTEELELGQRLIESGFELFHQPDPKCFVTHFKFGFRSMDATRNIGTDEERERFLRIVGLNRMNQLSNLQRCDSGNRVERDTWCHSKLLSYFVFFALRSEDAAERWMSRQYHEFVEDNVDTFYAGTYDAHVDRQAREEIWNSAQQDGRRLVAQLKHAHARSAILSGIASYERRLDTVVLGSPMLTGCLSSQNST